MSLQNIDLTERSHFKNTYNKMNSKPVESERIPRRLRSGVIPSVKDRINFNYVNSTFNDNIWFTIDTAGLNTTISSSSFTGSFSGFTRNSFISENVIEELDDISLLHHDNNSINITNRWIDTSISTVSHNDITISYNGQNSSNKYTFTFKNPVNKDDSILARLSRKGYEDQFEPPKIPYVFDRHSEAESKVEEIHNKNRIIKKLEKSCESDNYDDYRVPPSLWNAKYRIDDESSYLYDHHGYMFPYHLSDDRTTKSRLLKNAPYIKNVYKTNGNRSFDEKELNLALQMAEERFHKAIN